jgi:hypothetical protein
VTTQVAFGKVLSVGSQQLFVARVSESMSEGGTSAASTNDANTGEIAEIAYPDADVWVTVSGTASVGTTYKVAAGAVRWIPGLADGDTINLITA